jgi:hypothetical protein
VDSVCVLRRIARSHAEHSCRRMTQSSPLRGDA